jgi:hypothetical protein
MSSEPSVLDERSRCKERERPVRLLSHARTAAMLCITAIMFHLLMGFRGTRNVVWVELGLVLYGVIAAALSCDLTCNFARLARSDKVWLCCCGMVYLLTLAWTVLAPSLN